MVDVVVVGAGPNGLAAAITLARENHSVLVLEAAETPGGGARTKALVEPNVLHDLCSAVHPLGAASPFLTSLPLAHHGLEWLHPEIPLVHPLDDGMAVLDRDLQRTIDRLDDDGPAWGSVVGSLVSDWDDTVDLALAPPLRAVRRPWRGLTFGLRTIRSAGSVAGRFEGDRARALIAGNAAHAVAPLDRSATGGVALVLAAAGHAVGWPVAAGGSQAITDAMAAHLVSLGGEIVTDTRVEHLSEVPDAAAVVLDTAPSAAARIAGDRISVRTRRRYRRHRHAPGVFKLDLVLDGPIPWPDEFGLRAGTIHVGGTFEEIAAAEAAVDGGGHPDRPFVLLSQPRVVDPSRSPEHRHPIWAYTHVPAGSTVDMTEPILRQIERFAPGFRDRIVAVLARGPAELEHDNPNYVGGDITGGAISLWGLLRRPQLFRPYRAEGGIYLCSASTPPGAGVHGMCGYWAAQAVLSDLRRR